MIVVKADLLSAISEDRDRSLCEVEIANDASLGIGPRGCYDVRLYSASSTGKRGRLIRSARVEDWPREAKPAWRLVQAAFEALGC